ncbi:MAG: quinolinate synthase NadA [Calditrichales bacterium]|nr:quinolinate synthase NadA [Calditrichales bacterium]
MLNRNQKKLIKEINLLKKEKEAVILVHNYQWPEIYEVADFIGDSFELARKASALKKIKRIIFCGVDFMAESAAILNPDKEVYLPAKDACCPMAAMVDVQGLRELQNRFPKAATVCYVNTSAEVKAISDICCTSSNAVKIVKSLPQDEIIFVPDKNLALYVAGQIPEKKIIPWEGFCYVHQRFTIQEVKQAKENYPDAEVIAHPECTPEVIELADHVCSTGQMIDYARKSKAYIFIVLTEVGMTERLKKEVPQKTFLTPVKTCIQMKRNSLELVRDSLQLQQHRIIVPENISRKAKIALERMLKFV